MRGEMRSDPQRHHPGALARLALIAFGVIVALAIVVGFVLLKADDWAVFTDPARDGVRVAYYRDDADLGYGPLPGRTVRARKTVAGRVIYDVLYTIDDDGGRATPGDPQGRSFLFFGDSCTFGEGVGDNETMPAAFARASRKGAPVELGYAASADWAAFGEFRLGAEAFGNLGTTRDFLPRDEHFAGPMIRTEIEHLPGNGELEIETGYLFALGKSRDETDGQFRLVLEYEFHF